MQRVKQACSNVDLGLNVGDQCDFVCGTMSHAKLSLDGSVILDVETSIA